MKTFEKYLPKGIKVIKIPHHSPEWYAFREKNGLGASDAPTVLRLKYWDSFGIWGLWSKLVGLVPQSNHMTEFMHHGYWLEEYIADQWQFWDNNVDQFGEPSYIDRWQSFQEAQRNKTGNKMDYVVRACVKVNGFIVNPDYPNLFVSLDRWVYPDQPKIDFESYTKTGFPLECKNLSEFSAKSYVTGFPEHYHAQAQLQMAVCKVDYMEFAMLHGGNRLRVDGFEINKQYVAEIVFQCQQFWTKNVLPAREIMQKIKAAEIRGDMVAVEDYMNIMHQDYAPDPTIDDAEFYYNYLTESAKRRLDPNLQMQGSEDSFVAGLKWSIWDYWRKICEKRAMVEKNKILTEMLNNQVYSLEYGEDHGRLVMIAPEGSRFYPKNNLKLNLKEDLLSKVLPTDIADPDEFMNWDKQR